MQSSAFSLMSLGLLACAALCLAGCGPDLSTPEQTLKVWCEARTARDHELMLKCVVESERAKTKDRWDADREKYKDRKPKDEVFTPKGIKKDGDWTIATYDWRVKGYEGSDVKMILVQEGGNWYVSARAGEEYRAAQLGFTPEELEALADELTSDPDRGPLDE